MQEKLLLMGGIGVGKSTGAVSIADAHPADTVHYIVADRAIDKLYDRYPAARQNIIEYPGYDFAAIVSYIEAIKQGFDQEVQQKQWVVIDTIGEVYRLAQEFLAESRYHLDSFSLRETRMTKDGKGYEQGFSADGFSSLEWRWITRRFYNDIVYPLVRYSRINTVLISHPLPIQGAFFSRPVSQVAGDRFKEIGLTVDAHRELPRYVDTIIYMEIEQDKRLMRTIKDTGRTEFAAKEFQHFWTDYARLAGIVPNGQ